MTDEPIATYKRALIVFIFAVIMDSKCEVSSSKANGKSMGIENSAIHAISAMALMSFITLSCAL